MLYVRWSVKGALIGQRMAYALPVSALLHAQQGCALDVNRVLHCLMFHVQHARRQSLPSFMH